jgi:hypothetical protein
VQLPFIGNLLLLLQNLVKLQPSAPVGLASLALLHLFSGLV